jgi:hypothetical protein
MTFAADFHFVVISWSFHGIRNVVPVLRGRPANVTRMYKFALVIIALGSISTLDYDLRHDAGRMLESALLIGTSASEETLARFYH